MSSRIVLKVLTGDLGESRFTYDEPIPVILGRGRDCAPRIPSTGAYESVSRHHCMIDINPPHVRVRDMGSLNGTYINGQSIGMRADGQSVEGASQVEFSQHDLQHGDQLALGNRENPPVMLEVHVEQRHACDRCGVTIGEPDIDLCDRDNGFIICPECWRRESTVMASRFLWSKSRDTRTLERDPHPPEPRRACACCGGDITHEADGQPPGAYVCMECREDPGQIMRLLVEKANENEDPALSTLRGYRLLDTIGSGGQGYVRLAEHLETREAVAIKMLLPDAALSHFAQQKFITEGSNMLRLNHPNIVRAYSLGTHAATFFYAMEFCELGSVDRLQRALGGTLPLDLAAHIVLQVLDGLDAASRVPVKVLTHDGVVEEFIGLVHRDLKPENIFLKGDRARPVAKVGDFGLSKAFEAAGLAGYTCTRQSAGSPWFMSRQQATNYKYAKPDVDVFAAAASMYFMLTRQFPREFPRGADPWRIVLEDRCVPIRRRNARIPKRLAAVLDEALDDTRELRFKSAAGLKAALTETL